MLSPSRLNHRLPCSRAGFLLWWLRLQSPLPACDPPSHLVRGRCHLQTQYQRRSPARPCCNICNLYDGGCHTRRPTCHHLGKTCSLHLISKPGERSESGGHCHSRRRARTDRFPVMLWIQHARLRQSTKQPSKRVS